MLQGVCVLDWSYSEGFCSIPTTHFLKCPHGNHFFPKKEQFSNEKNLMLWEEALIESYFSHCREVNQNWNFIKIIWCLHHFKALNERISEWAHFLNLAKGSRRCLKFSAPKNEVFLDKTLREVTYLKWHHKEGFWGVFLQFSGNKHITLLKMTLNLTRSKSLFDVKFYGTWQEKAFRSQSSDIWGLGS